MPRVSVIIPTHNCAHYLQDALRSVVDQSYQDFEVIVVDDGSTDNTDEVCAAYASDRRVTYVKRPREGLPAARNAGIEIAGSDLIAFLDADDLFLPDKLLIQAGIFENNCMCDICYTDEIYFDEENGEETLSNRYRFSGDIFYYLKRSNFIHVSTVMAKKAILKKYGFDETLKSHEDWELFLRIAYHGMHFSYIRKPLSRIRVRQDSMTVNTDTMARSRREVGLRAKAYWSDFKRQMHRPLTHKGRQAITRYTKMKTKAFLIGFPKRNCFNRPVPQEILTAKTL